MSSAPKARQEADEAALKWHCEQAHTYLERIRKAGIGIEALRRVIEDAKTNASLVKAVDYSVPHAPGGEPDAAMVNAVERLRLSIASYCEQLASYEEDRFRACQLIDRMDDPTLARLLKLRYALNQSYEEISVDLNYSYDYTLALRRKALAAFFEVMPKNDIPKAL